MTPLTVFLIFICASVLGFQIYSLSLVRRYRLKAGLFETENPVGPTDTFPSISVIVPVKGPVRGLKNSVKSLLSQDYPGTIEFIFAFQDERDPSLPDLDKILLEELAETPKRRVKILRGLKFLGFNPKNSNLVHGMRASESPWIFVCDIDTRLSPRHLRACMQLTRGHDNKFVTASTVHDGAKTLPAMLEGIGTNISLTTFFLLTYFNDKKTPGPINGAAYLFSKQLLAKAGGPDQILNVLTDDSVFERSFKKAGGYGVLAPDFVRVTLEEQTFKGFVQRQFRWMLIAKCYFFPGNLITPFLWVWQWLALIGIVTHDSRFIKAGLFICLCRVGMSFAYQFLLGAPKTDLPKAIVLTLCDVLIPILWILGLPVRNVNWAGQILRVNRDGTLSPSAS